MFEGLYRYASIIYQDCSKIDFILESSKHSIGITLAMNFMRNEKKNVAVKLIAIVLTPKEQEGINKCNLQQNVSEMRKGKKSGKFV